MEGKLTFEMSPTIGTLIGALAKARKQFKPVIKSSSNPFFKSKYADLAEVIEATKDGLSDNGLAVLQPPAFARETGTVEILTIVAHSSGEWIKGILDMPTNKTDAQGVGSAITYGRRYAYSAIVNVASEEDDDGNGAVSGDFKKVKQEESPEEFDQRTETQTRIGPYQIQGFDEACKRTGKTEEEVKTFLGLSGHKLITDILKGEFQTALKWANTTGKSGTVAAKAILKPANGNLVKSFDHAWPKLWGRAKELGISQDDVKTYYREVHGVEHGNQLTPLQFKDVCEWLEAVKV